MKILVSLVFLALMFQANDQTVIKLQPGEKWWGGAVNEGHKMPFGTAPYALDLYGTNVGNQCSPLLCQHTAATSGVTSRSNSNSRPET